jgi:hypothetical protein
MKIRTYKKIFAFVILSLFIGAGVIPNISGNTKNNYIKPTEEYYSNIPLNDDYIDTFWKFDECSGNTVGDSSGHNHDGTIYGATWTSGYSGCALSFDGIDDYVDFSDHAPEIMFNKTDDIILSFYFKSDSEGLIFSSTAPWGNNPEFRLELLSNGSLLFYKITQLCGIKLYSNGVYNDGDWHKAEYYYNGITSNPTVSLYVDDTLDITKTHWLCEIENDDYSKTKMGMHSHSDADYFNGLIDEFKIIKYEQGNKQAPPEISGPTIGEPNVQYDYTFITNDPEEDDITTLIIDWGDGDTDEISGPFGSGEEVIVSHEWAEEDNYCIKAKSKDIWYESSWSECYEVFIGNQQPEPPEIDGPKCGEKGEELTYTFVSNDFEEHDIYYYIEWGDGTFDDWFGPYPSGEEAIASHSWNSDGEYEITAIAKDSHDSLSEESEPYPVRIGNQSPPEAPEIDGPKKGGVGISYSFLFMTTDPDGDDVIYEIDWGDNSFDEEGPIKSGEEIIINHAWDMPSTYVIRARAKDVPCNTYSDWSEMEIKIPRNRAFSINLVDFLFERFPQALNLIKELLKF